MQWLAYKSTCYNPFCTLPQDVMIIIQESILIMLSPTPDLPHFMILLVWSYSWKCPVSANLIVMLLHHYNLFQILICIWIFCTPLNLIPGPTSSFSIYSILVGKCLKPCKHMVDTSGCAITLYHLKVMQTIRKQFFLNIQVWIILNNKSVIQLVVHAMACRSNSSSF